MRHGYYIAATGRCHGDDEFARLALAAYYDHCAGHTKPGHYDGCSVFESGDKIVTRLSVQDFFSTEFKVHVVDL